MLKVKFGFFTREEERAEKMCQVMQEMHDIINSSTFKDKLTLASKKYAKEELTKTRNYYSRLLQEFKILSEVSTSKIYICEVGSFYWNIKSFFGNKFLMIDPDVLDISSTKSLAVDLLIQICVMSGLPRRIITQKYIDCHLKRFGEKPPYPRKVVDRKAVAEAAPKIFKWETSC